MNNEASTIECMDSWAKAQGLATYTELLQALQPFTKRNSSEEFITIRVRTADVTRARTLSAKAARRDVNVCLIAAAPKMLEALREAECALSLMHSYGHCNGDEVGRDVAQVRAGSALDKVSAAISKAAGEEEE